MAIVQSDLSLKKAENNSDLSTNGGRLSNNPVSASLFPDVSGTERAAGVSRLRKLFLKNEQGSGTAPDKYVELTLLQALVYLENITPADDRILLKAGTAVDTQAESSLYTGWAGAGYLYDASIAPNATTCQVEVEADGASGEIFQNGGMICITDGVNKEFLLLNSVSYVGKVYTLGFTQTPTINGFLRAADTRTADINTGGTIGYTGAGMLTNQYANKRVRIKSATTGAGQVRRIVSNSNSTLVLEYPFTVTPTGTVVYEILSTYVSMCVSLGGIVASSAIVSKTLGQGGLFDETKIKLFPIGTKDDQWTILFSNSTTFTITGVKYGTIGGGTISTVTKISTGTSYYFEIPIDAWTAPFQTGDRIVFTTSSSSKGFWLKEVVPAGANPHSANSWDLSVSGDTV